MSPVTDSIVFKSREEQAVEARYGQDIAAVLREMYHERRLSQAAMAAELGVNRTTVVDWMKRHRVPTGYNRGAEVVA